jgi:hypothetical protein
MSRTRKDDGREQGHADVGSRHSHSYTNGSPCVDCLRKDNLYELKQIELHDAEEQIAKESQAKIRREVKLWNREGEMAVTVNNLKAELRHVKLSHLETQRALEEAKIKTVHHDRNITQVRLEASERVLNFTNTIRRLEQELAIQSGLHTSVPQHGTNMSSAAGNINYIDRDDSHSRAPRQSQLYTRYESFRQQPRQTGKVWPTNYGSNGHWDLVLCHVTFSTPDSCRNPLCAWRHTGLTSEERAYISTLGPAGLRFVEYHDRKMDLSRQ